MHGLQKQKISRKLNDKEEEMEVAMSKSNSMEQEISETKTFRKDLEAQLEDTFVEASQEHKPHESRENLSKQTESELEVPLTSQGG